MLLVKIGLIIVFSAICYQDARDRLVYWFLFVLAGVFLGILHYQSAGFKGFIVNAGINIMLVIFMFFLLQIYAKGVRGYSRLQEVFGLGDICMILALGLGSATMAFMILLVFGLLFTIVLHGVMKGVTLSRKQKQAHTTVPLAGYLAIFFGGVFIAHWSGIYTNLYIL